MSDTHAGSPQTMLFLGMAAFSLPDRAKVLPGIVHDRKVMRDENHGDQEQRHRRGWLRPYPQ